MAGKRARAQNQRRAANVRYITRRLAKRLKGEAQQVRIHGTNRLLPNGSLKRKCLREIFGGWVHRYGHGRMFTKRLGKEVCDALRDKFGMGPCEDEAEAHRMASLLVLARKRQVSRPCARAMNMDNLETMPMEFQALQLILQHVILRVYQPICIYIYL